MRVVGSLLLLVLAFGCKEDKGPSGPTTISEVGESERLIRGIAATGQLGDFILDNGKARFLVQDIDTATGWGIYGGSLVDVAPVREDGREDDRLQELFVQCDLRAFRPATAEIINDGSNGEAAVLRFVGDDAGIPFLDAILTRDPLDVTITVDYILPPDSATLEIAISVKDERKREPREISCGLVMIRGDENDMFLDGKGASDDAGGAQPYIAAAAHDAPGSWALFQKDKELNVILAELGIVPIGPDPVPFLANATVTESYFVSLGHNGDVESALAEMRRSSATDTSGLQPVSLSLAGFEGLALDEAVFTLWSEDRAVTAARSAIDAPATLQVAPGDYRVEVDVSGRPFESFDLSVNGPTTEEHTLQTVGRLLLSVEEVDRQGQTLSRTPARLWVTDTSDAKVLEAYVLPDEAVLLPSGSYTAFLSRGPAHEIFSAPIEIRAGQTTPLEAKIERVVDLTGWVTIDTHVHSTRSNDSDVGKRARVVGAVAEGVDILVATDHDGVTNYGPMAASLQLTDRLTTVGGVEMSMLYGHINGFPLNPEPERYFNPSWAVYENGRYSRMLEPAEVAAALRNVGVQIVQANHPRSDQGVFGRVGLDATTGLSEKEWPNFDAAEALNGKRLDEYEEVMQDIHALIQAGRRVTATGSSDSHSEFSGLGYARTVVQAPAGDLDAVFTAIQEGRVLAANGPYVFFKIEGAELGDTHEGSGPMSLQVRVEAPSWVSAEQLRIYENGQILVDRMLTESDRDSANPHVRFQGTFTATPTADSYYMAEVLGSSSPPLIKESASVTNPIFVDTDGGGFNFTR